MKQPEIVENAVTRLANKNLNNKAAVLFFLLGLITAADQLVYSFFNVYDFEDGPPKRVPDIYRPLFYFDPTSGSFKIDEEVMNSQAFSRTNTDTEKRRYFELVTNINRFINGDKDSFEKFFPLMDELVDPHYHEMNLITYAPPHIFQEFIRLARNYMNNKAGSEDENYTNRINVKLNRLESTYYQRYLGHLLAPFEGVGEIPDYSTNAEGFMLEYLEHTNNLESSLSQLEPKQLQLRAMKILQLTYLIEDQLKYPQYSTESNLASGLVTKFGSQDTVIRRIGILRDEIGRILKANLDDNDNYYLTFGDDRFLLPLVRSGYLRDYILRRDAEALEYWQGVFNDLGLDPDRASDLPRNYKIEPISAFSPTADTPYKIRDFRPREGLQAPAKVTVHELAHMLEPNVEQLKSFLEILIKYANQDSPTDYPKFAEWAKTLLDGNQWADISFGNSYTGLMHGVTQDEVNQFLRSDENILGTNYLGVTVSLPGESFASLIDSVWQDFDAEDIPPDVNAYVSEVLTEKGYNMSEEGLILEGLLKINMGVSVILAILGGVVFLLPSIISRLGHRESEDGPRFENADSPTNY